MAPTFNFEKRRAVDSIWQYSRQDILSDLLSPEVSFLS
jgi:3-oxoacyl-ACP reductase-like protein